MYQAHILAPLCSFDLFNKQLSQFADIADTCKAEQYSRELSNYVLLLVLSNFTFTNASISFCHIFGGKVILIFVSSKTFDIK